MKMRINDLIQPIKDLVDTSRISLVAAVELSYLDAGEQWLVYRGILSRGLKLIHRAAEASCERRCEGRDGGQYDGQ